MSPTDTEKFHLRLLLLHVPGAMSYNDLKTVNGVVCASFQDACIQSHLLTDDNEYSETIAEASNFQIPKHHSMFATICIYCQPSDSLLLWTTHKDALIEEFAATTHNCEVAENEALHELERIFHENSSSCATIGLPSPHGPASEDLPSIHESAPTFTDITSEQHHLGQCVLLQSVMGGEVSVSRLHYVDAPGGSGKTYVFNMLFAHLRHQNLKVACADWTGIATTLMICRRTVHSLFKLPIPVLENSTCNVSPTSHHAELLRVVDLFVVDEASMIPSHALHAMNRYLQDITQDERPLGVKTVLLGGDFHQVLPVVPQVPPAVIIDTCLKHSPLWPLFKQHKLTRNMRTLPGEDEFAAWLLQVGN